MRSTSRYRLALFALLPLLAVGLFFVMRPTATSPQAPRSAVAAAEGDSGNTSQLQVALPPSQAPKAPPVAAHPQVAAVPASARPELTAVVKLANNKAVELTPNTLGLFPRVLLGKEQTVPISLTYPDGEPGEILVISAEDGGKVNATSPVQTAPLDANRQLNFKFTTTQNEGVYRVSVRRGAEQQQFDFWVGTEPAPQSGRSTL